MGTFSRGQTGTRMPGAMSPTMAARIHTAITSLATILAAEGASAPRPPPTRVVCQVPPRGDRCRPATYDFYSHDCSLRKVLSHTPVSQVEKPALGAAT